MQRRKPAGTMRDRQMKRKQERVPFHPERAELQGCAQHDFDPEWDSTNRPPLSRCTITPNFSLGIFASHDKQPTVETVAGVLDSRDGDPSAYARIDRHSPILEFLNIKWLRDLPQSLRVPRCLTKGDRPRSSRKRSRIIFRGYNSRRCFTEKKRRTRVIFFEIFLLYFLKRGNFDWLWLWS